MGQLIFGVLKSAVLQGILIHGIVEDAQRLAAFQQVIHGIADKFSLDA